MLLRGFIPNFVLLVWILFAAVDASSLFPMKKTTSCGQVEFQQCWCLEENPCNDEDESTKIDPTDVIPISLKKNTLTAEYIQKHINSESPTDLHLQGKKFESIDKSAFDNFTNLKSLDLSNNNLSKLPAFIFSKLTNLEHLNLSGNGMKTTRKLFAGLANLKTLDLTKNPLSPVLEDNCFFGLTKSCEIHVTPKSVKKMTTEIFGNEPSTPLQDSANKASNEEASKSKSIHTRSIQWSSQKHTVTQLKICIENNTVQQLDELEALEELENGCQEVNMRFNQLNLENLDIVDFKKGWYRLQGRNKVLPGVSVLRIVGNNMPTVSQAVVNDLPDYITWLDMKNNKIERLTKGTFEHKRIFSLELNDNLIAEIEDNTFKMPKLYQLFMSNNRLKNTKFFATMPASLTSIYLRDNEITEISPNSLSNLENLGYLNLERNRITTIGNNCFRGEKLLGTILLSMNNITTIEPGVFDNSSFGVLSFDYNQISTIEKGVFNDLVDVQYLSIAGNKLKKILSETFDLPTVERMDLSGNQITVIEKAAMKGLGRLNELDLSSNAIDRLENGALFGLNKTQRCIINLDETPVASIFGGVFDDFDDN